jgi:hypothetical protein
LGVSEGIIGISIISYGKNSFDLRPTLVTTSPRERIEFVSQEPTVHTFFHPFIHSFIPLPCAECDNSLLFSAASTIPLRYILLLATLLHQLINHPPSLHLAIYFLVYLLDLLIPNSYTILYGNSIFFHSLEQLTAFFTHICGFFCHVLYEFNSSVHVSVITVVTRECQISCSIRTT